MMKFWEAMKALDEGKKVRCSLWCKGAFVSKETIDDWWIESTSGYHDEQWEIFDPPAANLSEL